MSTRALLVSILLAVVWTGAALITYRTAVGPATVTRIFVAETVTDRYVIHADEARVEGFCTVFVKDGVRIAAVCGQHTWSEATAKLDETDPTESQVN